MRRRAADPRAPRALVATAFALLAAVSAAASPAAAVEARPDTIAGHRGTCCFCRGLNYGSQSLEHPPRLVINGGFGIMQIENRDNRPGRVRSGTGGGQCWPDSMIQYQLTDDGRHSLFHRWGSHAELGLSCTDARGRCVTIGTLRRVPVGLGGEFFETQSDPRRAPGSVYFNITILCSATLPPAFRRAT